MYEKMTYEKILARMLAAAPADVDKREGSILFDALAPAAMELAQMYIELDVVLNESFADSASREFLMKRAAERGLNPYPAACAVMKGVFNCPIPLKSRFSLGIYHYTAEDVLSDSEHSYRMVCGTPGREPNSLLGRLVPSDLIQGLQSAEITEVLIPGEDEEDTEHFRQRYFDSLNLQAFGGNITDYKNYVHALDGVGGVKVYPVWQGGGTVQLVIVDADFSKPSVELLNAVQEAMDPMQNQGRGLGMAPIGHVVTVEGAGETPVDLSFSLTYQKGWGWVDLKTYVEQVIDGYFQELNQGWADKEFLIIRRSQLESRLLDLEGILDVENLLLNNQAENLFLDKNCIAIRGLIHV